MKKVIIDTLKINWSINISVWIIIYLFRTFVVWRFENPFQWIIDIPSYTQEQRGLGLFGIVSWQLIQMFMIFIDKAGLNKTSK